MIRVDLGQDSSRGYVGWVIGCGLILKVVEAHKYGLIVDCLESFRNMACYLHYWATDCT